MRPTPSALATLALLALLATAATAQLPTTTQRLTDTLPVLPDVYASRVAQFGREPLATGRVVFLGNSITQGGDWPRLTGDSTAVNRGIGGDVTFGVRARLDEVVRRRPSKLFLLIGINDVSKDIPEAVIAGNVRALVEAVRAGSPETVVYVQSVLPVNPTVPGFPQHYDKGDHVVRLNRLLRTAAASTRARFVDLYPLFLDRQGRLDVRWTRDGLHLNEAGYQRWVAYLRKTGAL